MNEFRFANPAWIHAVWAALLLAALLVILDLRGRAVLDLLLSRLMQQRLVHRTSASRRITSLILATLSLILLIVALMRPQWGRTVQQSLRIDSQIMVCLDVSKSMLAEDVAPSRLERAKVELDSLLGLMQDDQQVGLIAFAGKATVLCPMTTDFGFLRLVLAEAGPNSVGQGGTKIGVAIQKALDGFREAGDIQRLILLITDGEDHDSYPIEAAKRASEAGVRIVAVGFGDELGSKIEITDPVTGVRTFLKDSEGREVDSRLDGELLRSIIRETKGAYVPAGTGALDLDSIYHKHIETMLKGSLDAQQRVVRNEAYQWFVLAAFLLLIMALACATPWNLRARALLAAQSLGGPSPGTTTGAAILLIFALCAPSSLAQSPQASGDRSAGQAPASGPTATDTLPPARKPSADQAPVEKDDVLDDSLPPRTAYNQALAFLDRDPDRAERYLNHARRSAGTDGELRFRTLYNLGWVEVHRADAALKEDPQQALPFLHQAANRFREAIRVRPDNDEARQNLEIISRRILELTDALREKEPGDLATRLDALISQTREHQRELQTIVQQTSRDASTAVDAYRAEFHRLAVTQRQLISDTQQFTDDARAERDAIVKKPEQEQAPADKLRAVQLENLSGFADSSIQRMNMSRSLTRRLQGDGAFRRWSAALSDLKRARDQLRNPVEVLGQIIADAAEMVQVTNTLAAGKLALPDDQGPAEAPAWITKDYVADLLAATTQRTTQLEQTFTSISAAQTDADSSTGQSIGDAANEPQTQQLLKNIRAAIPLIQQARESFDQADQELQHDALDPARGKQIDGITQLSKAWELFFDVRRMIELIYGQQKLAHNALEQSASHPDVARQLTLPLLELQQANLTRCDRLAELLQFEEGRLPPPATENAAPPSPNVPLGTAPAESPAETEEVAAQRQRLELAQQLLTQVKQEMQQASDLLQAMPDSSTAESPPVVEPEDEHSLTSPADQDQTANPKSDEGQSPPAQAAAGPLHDVSQAVDRSLTALEQLRRLYFSLVEHLRDTAQRQADLNDDTTQVAGEPDAAQQPENSGPLALRQQQLQDIARQLAEALKQQGDQAAAAAQEQPKSPAGASQTPPPDATAAAKKLSQAAELVDAAQESMHTAADQLLAISQGKGTPKDPFPVVQERQAQSLQKLLEALALLQQDDQQNSPPENQSDQQQQQQQQESSEQNQQQQQQQMDANQLLQLIRDREAERRKDKNRRAQSSSAPVEKDW